MKTFTKIFSASASASASALVLAISAPVSAMVSPDLTQSIQAAGGYDSNVDVRIDGNTVSLSGFVEDEASLQRIEQTAKSGGAEIVNNKVHTLGTSGFGSG